MAREYSEETKAAVMAALLAGQSVSAVARQYNIPKGTVSAWNQRHVAPLQAGVATVATQKSKSAGDAGALVGSLLLELVTAELRGLIAQAQHTADKEWLNQQEASQLAVLHGVAHDKIFRLLEAMDRAGRDTEPAETS